MYPVSQIVCTWDTWALEGVGKCHANLSHAVTFQQRVSRNLLPALQGGKRQSSRARNHQPEGRQTGLRESTAGSQSNIPRLLCWAIKILGETIKCLWNLKEGCWCRLNACSRKEMSSYYHKKPYSRVEICYIQNIANMYVCTVHISYVWDGTWSSPCTPLWQSPWHEAVWSADHSAESVLNKWWEQPWRRSPWEP